MLTSTLTTRAERVRTPSPTDSMARPLASPARPPPARAGPAGGRGRGHVRRQRQPGRGGRNPAHCGCPGYRERRPCDDRAGTVRLLARAGRRWAARRAGPSQQPPGGSGGREVVGGAVAPLHPPRIVQDGPGVGDAGAFEEHGQVVVAVGGTEDLVPALTVHRDPPAARKGTAVHDDRRTAHPFSMRPRTALRRARRRVRPGTTA